MARRRSLTAKAREEAIELLALGETEPADVAAAVGVAVEELLRWRKTRAFGAAVAQRSRELLRDMIPFVLARVVEQARAGQNAQQRLLLQYHLDLEKLDLERQSDVWTITWGSEPPAAPAPVSEDAEADGPPAPAAETPAEKA